MLTGTERTRLRPQQLDTLQIVHEHATFETLVKFGDYLEGGDSIGRVL